MAAKWVDTVEDVCEKLTKELKKANDKLEKSNGEVNERDAEYVKNLMSAIKSAQIIKAMAESEEYSNDYRGNNGGGQSMRGGSYGDGRSYGDGNSYGYDDMSFARGRGRNANRDSMGRYTSEGGYSRTDVLEDMANDIRKAMPSMPEEMKQNARRFLNDLEQHM